MAERYPHVNKMNKYCRDVLSGKISACMRIKEACQRHQNDLKRSKAKKSRWKFDKEKAELVCEFIECLVHVKGKWAGESLILELWQCFIVCSIFGWVDRSSGIRRFTKASIYVPRKNGKSPLAAAIANYMFVADGEAGAEVYVGATTEKQAWEVFRPAKQMIEKSPDIKDFFGIDIFAKSMFHYETASRLEPVVGDPGDGGSVHCAIVDEYHEHKTSSLYDTMETGTTAREQPLVIIITTTGTNKAGPCGNDYDYVTRILKGTIEDDRVFGIIYGIDDDDDWTDFEVWKKANPNYGVSVNPEVLRQKYVTAMQNPAKQNIIRCKHLNQWLTVDTAWADMLKVQKCKNLDLVIEQMKGKKCVLGLDLASKIDLAALIILFYDGDKYYCFGKYYSPRATVEKPENTHYQTWEIEERLTVTEGERIDFSIIKEDVIEICKAFDVDAVAYDPFQATQLSAELTEEGITMIETRATVLNFSEPMKELEALVNSQKFEFDGCPILYWMFSNVVAHYDKKENIYPNKERVENKIDGIVALIMALGAMLRLYSKPEEPTPGIIVI